MLTNSLKVNTKLAPDKGTLVVPGSGTMFIIKGGIVSLSPQEGDSVVLAQECMNIIGPRIEHTAMMSGMNRFISNISSYYILYAFNSSKAFSQLTYHLYIVYQKFYITFKHASFAGEL